MTSLGSFPKTLGRIFLRWTSNIIPVLVGDTYSDWFRVDKRPPYFSTQHTHTASKQVSKDKKGNWVRGEREIMCPPHQTLSLLPKKSHLLLPSRLSRRCKSGTTVHELRYRGRWCKSGLYVEIKKFPDNFFFWFWFYFFKTLKSI